MTKLSMEQIEALLEYVDARIDEKISDSQWRDDLQAGLKTAAAKGHLIGCLLGEED